MNLTTLLTAICYWLLKYQWIKIQIKLSLEQATEAPMGRRGTALFFL
jgi:hypothetical protein